MLCSWKTKICQELPDTFFHEKQIQGDGTYAEFIGNHRRGKPFPIFDSLSALSLSSPDLAEMQPMF